MTPDDSTLWVWFVPGIFGYLLGSVPFGLVLTKMAGLGDVRTIGSGNIGATNVLRTGNKPLALAVLLLDGGKGAIAALIATFALSPVAGVVAGFFAVLGHNFPVWLKFKGGKGVATTLGAILAVAWPVGIAVCLTWATVANVFRYSSLAAIVALASAPFWSYWLVGGPVIGMTAALAILGVARHHANIKRLIQGEESKIGKKKKTESEGA